MSAGPAIAVPASSPFRQCTFAGTNLHLYGKREARHGRKMGHVTIVADRADEATRRGHLVLRPGRRRADAFLKEHSGFRRRAAGGVDRLYTGFRRMRTRRGQVIQT